MKLSKGAYLAPLLAATCTIPPADSGPHFDLESHVLLIGIDGVRSDALQSTPTPCIDALMDKGVYDLDIQLPMKTANGETRETSSGPGWATILTGVTATKHNVLNNKFKDPQFAEYPTIFTRIDTLVYTAAFISWKPLKKWMTTDADTVHFKNYKYGDDTRVMGPATTYLSNARAHFTFAYLSDVDRAGHSRGFHPEVPFYVKQLREADADVCTLVNAVESRPNRENEQWMYMIVTDHGGLRKKKHGGDSPQERTIWYVAAGDGIKHGPIEVSGQQDYVPTILDYLNIAIPEDWGLDGTPIDQY